MRHLLAYVGTGVIMGVLDAIWLTVMSPRLYKPAIGELMAAKPDMRAAVAFYLIYVFGIVFLAVLPALREGSGMRAALMGAVLGLVAYATYDLTNQATLRVWPAHVTLIDLAWGVFVTTAAALGGYWLAARFAT
jgi:uncharacterized membrane protein